MVVAEGTRGEVKEHLIAHWDLLYVGGSRGPLAPPLPPLAAAGRAAGQSPRGAVAAGYLLFRRSGGVMAVDLDDGG